VRRLTVALALATLMAWSCEPEVAGTHDPGLAACRTSGGEADLVEHRCTWRTKPTSMVIQTCMVVIKAAWPLLSVNKVARDCGAGATPGVSHYYG